MASEEPPSIEHTLQEATRINSAPPTGAANTTTDSPALNMSSPTKETSPADVIEQQSNIDIDLEANNRLVGSIGQDGEQTNETGGTNAEQGPASTTVKAEPESGASALQTVPTIPSKKNSEEPANDPLKQEGGKAAVSSPNPQQQINITLDNLQRLADSNDLFKRESGVEEAQAVLDKLQLPLSDSKQPKLQEWLATISRLKQQSKNTRTVVAVVGETGAGKTSLINALLDEDKLLVTSGWRACTAVICEISYNENDDPQKAYRAEIEFVSQEDWQHDLQILYGDIAEDSNLTSAKLDGKTEAGIAYAKIQAVYPDLTDSSLMKQSARELAKRKGVAEVLGTTRRINCKNANDLSSAVQKYLDSKEKSTKMGPKKEKDMAFWPLIKVVRIFCRADVLSTGLVVVDLPGVADSNPARAAVAKKYMTDCSAVWVTAPIKRAADNKVAKDLMGKSSRLQMKLDGVFSTLTFICTMTDAIEFGEAIDSFDDDGQIQATNSREDEAQNMIEEKNDALKRLENQMQDSRLSYSELERELRTWKALRKKHQGGHQVYPPQVPSKRKRPAGPQRPGPSRKVIDEDSDEDEVPKETPLTADDISAKFDDLRNRFGSAEDDYDGMVKQHEALKAELIDWDKEKNDASVDAARLCVQRRNEIVKKSIRVDFAEGIRE